jgi:hypothetical protein
MQPNCPSLEELTEVSESSPNIRTVQVAPPSLVRRRVPPKRCLSRSPTAQPRWPSAAKLTDRSVDWLLLFCDVQVAPPLDVWRIMPLAPTAQPRWPSAEKVTEISADVLPLFCGAHVVPLSSVWKILPELTSQPCRPSAAKEIEIRLTSPTDGNRISANFSCGYQNHSHPRRGAISKWGFCHTQK